MIADVSNCFNVGSPVLNNQGEAALSPTVVPQWDPPPEASSCVAGTADRLQRFTPSANEPGLQRSDSVISINDNGAVAFPAVRDQRKTRARYMDLPGMLAVFDNGRTTALRFGIPWNHIYLTRSNDRNAKAAISHMA